MARKRSRTPSADSIEQLRKDGKLTVPAKSTRRTPGLEVHTVKPAPLSDARLQSAQRQTLVRQIGQALGNQRVQRVIAPWLQSEKKAETPSTGAAASNDRINQAQDGKPVSIVRASPPVVARQQAAPPRAPWAQRVIQARRNYQNLGTRAMGIRQLHTLIQEALGTQVHLAQRTGANTWARATRFYRATPPGAVIPIVNFDPRLEQLVQGVDGAAPFRPGWTQPDPLTGLRRRTVHVWIVLGRDAVDPTSPLYTQMVLRHEFEHARRRFAELRRGVPIRAGLPLTVEELELHTNDFMTYFLRLCSYDRRTGRVGISPFQHVFEYYTRVRRQMNRLPRRSPRRGPLQQALTQTETRIRNYYTRTVAARHAGRRARLTMFVHWLRHAQGQNWGGVLARQLNPQLQMATAELQSIIRNQQRRRRARMQQRERMGREAENRRRIRNRGR